LSASVTGSLSQFQSDPMMIESGSTTIAEWGANENGFNVATNITRDTFGKQWPIDGDDRGMKAFRYFRLPALLCGSGALKTQLIAF
jgi:hypothetical protein